MKTRSCVRSWVQVLPALTILAAVGCAPSVKEVVAPDGSSGYSIQCRKDHSSCLSRASELCPSGYSLLGASRGERARGGARDDVITPNLIADGHLYISCRDSSSGNLAAGTGDPVASATAHSEPPAGATGVQFGARAEQVREACESAGHAWAIAGNEGTCSGVNEELGANATLRVQFCDKTVCGLVVHVPLDHKWAETVGGLRQRVAARYGKPTQASLGLADERARVEFAWIWADGHLVRMRMSEDRSALTILYAAPSLKKETASNGL